MSDATNRATTLRVAIRRFGPFETAIEKQFADFKRATGSPLELEFESLDLIPLVESLFTNGGLRDGTWDVAFMVTDWLADAVEEGQILDLTDRMAANPVPDYPGGWSPALTRFQEFDGRTYGLPYHDGPECLVVRQDLFDDPAEQAAYLAQTATPLRIPKTWDEFAQVARFFTRPEQGQHGTVFAAFPDGHNTVYDFCIQLWSRGGNLHDIDATPTLDTPAGNAALEFLRGMITDRSATPPGLEGIDSVKSGELFAAGNIAMMVNWFGFAAVCEQPGCPVKGKVAIHPIPTQAGGGNNALIVYWLLCVAAGSPHADEAYAFIRHCASVEMDKVTTLEGGIGCRRSTWDDPEVNALIPFYHRLAELHETVRELPRSRALPALVKVIDAAVQTAITTDEPTHSILRQAQAAAAAVRL